MISLSYPVKNQCSMLMLILFCSFWLTGSGASAAPQQQSVAHQDLKGIEYLNSTETCEECHKKTTPAILREHAESAHGSAGVGCADCHGHDHQNMPLATAKKACEQCHPQETAEYLASDHSKTWENMQKSARYMKQPEAVLRQGCESCHRIGYGENDGRCDFCHTKHSFSKEEAARPESCYTCHMGPDHPQMEAYVKSKHHRTKATCTGCHFPGTHNANQNIDRLSPGYMGISCNECHDPAFNKKWLDGAEMLEKQGEVLLEQGRSLIKKLDQKKLLYPAPIDREPNPVEGRALVLGGHQLYEDTSRAEKLYFEMFKYLQIHLAQGAYHQDFKMAAYEGLIPLRNSLAELMAEAQLLEELAGNQQLLTPIRSNIRRKEKSDVYQNTYDSSFHGVLPDDRNKPHCGTCHGGGAYGPLGEKELEKTCRACHTESQTKTFMHDFEAMKNHAANLRHSSQLIIEEMIGKGVLKKGKDGQIELNFSLGSEANQSVAQAILDRLGFYRQELDGSLKNMIAGVSHSNPDYAHWYGNAQAKSDLIEIRDAAHKLEQIKEKYVR